MSPVHNDRKHRLHLIPLIIGALTIAAIPLAMQLHEKFSDSTSTQVKELLENEKNTVLKLGNENIDLVPVRKFYADNNHELIWFKDGQVTTDAHFFVRFLELSASEGLNPADYNVQAIKKRFQNLSGKSDAELEVALTSTLFKFATHLHNGRVHPNVADKIWPLHPKFLDVGAFVKESLHHNSLFSDLPAQSPPHTQYQRLRKSLTTLQQIADNGGWGILPKNLVIKPGMVDGRIVQLRKRLKIAGDLPETASDSSTYDDELKTAVIAYQRRHGILADGVIGADTIDTLNVPVEERIEQVLLNMERWRLMPRELGYRYILVNASGYDLVAVKDGQPDLTMRVIVGATDLQTPIFSSKINKVVLNPEWHVPRGIAVKELLPKQLKSHNYFAANNFRLTSFSGADVPLENVDWNQVGENAFPYELHQRAGRGNPLGRIKFFIPNEHDVYLHDTNNRGLFNNVIRDLSHGCIRLEEPMKLAKFVLKGDSAWTLDRVNSSINSGNTIEVPVNDPVPVHIVYFTAWVDDLGRINFYKDNYKRDAELRQALGFKLTNSAGKTAIKTPK